MPRKVKFDGGNQYVFDSVDDLADYVEENQAKIRKFIRSNFSAEFSGFDNIPDACAFARAGWADELPVAMDVAESAVSKVETVQTLTTFMPTFDVTGCDVDIARYLSGEPECMIDYPLTEIVKAGRVITLCLSICYSGSQSHASIIRRGQTMVALAMTLSHLGYACEIWTDFTTGMTPEGCTSVRTLVKSAHDVIDPERIMYSLAHPSSARSLNFAAASICGGWNNGGKVVRVPRNLPEGTIYVEGFKSGRDAPDAYETVLAHLRELEILPEE